MPWWVYFAACLALFFSHFLLLDGIANVGTVAVFGFGTGFLSLWASWKFLANKWMPFLVALAVPYGLFPIDGLYSRAHAECIVIGRSWNIANGKHDLTPHQASGPMRLQIECPDGVREFRASTWPLRLYALGDTLSLDRGLLGFLKARNTLPRRFWRTPEKS